MAKTPPTATPSRPTAKQAAKPAGDKARVTVLEAFSLRHNGEAVKGEEGKTVEIDSALALHLQAQKKVKVVTVSEPSAPESTPPAGEGDDEGSAGELA